MKEGEAKLRIMKLSDRCTLHHEHYSITSFQDKALQDSRGGLTLDLSWKHPDLFKTVGVFSRFPYGGAPRDIGPHWWQGSYHASAGEEVHQVCGFILLPSSLDRAADRNGNGIIDSNWWYTLRPDPGTGNTRLSKWKRYLLSNYEDGRRNPTQKGNARFLYGAGPRCHIKNSRQVTGSFRRLRSIKQISNQTAYEDAHGDFWRVSLTGRSRSVARRRSWSSVPPGVRLFWLVGINKGAFTTLDTPARDSQQIGKLKMSRLNWTVWLKQY